MRRYIDRDRDYVDRDVVRDDGDVVEDSNDVRSISGINFILGIWLIISPWILNYVSNSTAMWNQFAFGIVIAVLALIRYVAPRATFTSWLIALAGIWMIIAPFVLNYSRSVAYWNEVILGIVVAILAFSNMQAYTHRHHRGTA